MYYNLYSTANQGILQPFIPFRNILQVQMTTGNTLVLTNFVALWGIGSSVNNGSKAHTLELE